MRPIIPGALLRFREACKRDKNCERRVIDGSDWLKLYAPTGNGFRMPDTDDLGVVLVKEGFAIDAKGQKGSIELKLWQCLMWTWTVDLMCELQGCWASGGNEEALGDEWARRKRAAQRAKAKACAAS